MEFEICLLNFFLPTRNYLPDEFYNIIISSSIKKFPAAFKIIAWLINNEQYHVLKLLNPFLTKWKYQLSIGDLQMGGKYTIYIRWRKNDGKWWWHRDIATISYTSNDIIDSLAEFR